MKSALVLGCDDAFVAYTSVVARRAAMLSSEDFPIIVLSDGVSDDNKRLAQQFCPQMSFIEASHLISEYAVRDGAHFSRATYLRLRLDELLADFDHAVYIDSDVTPLVDLAPLLQMTPKASPVMATHDLAQLVDKFAYDQLPLSRSADYFQAGIMVLDLKGVREERIFKDALQFAFDHPDLCKWADQDALNAALNGRWQVLDWRWNVAHFAAVLPRPFYIQHHVGIHKPWSADRASCGRSTVRLWRAELASSPWPQKFIPQNGLRYAQQAIRPLVRAVENTIKRAKGRTPKGANQREFIRRLPTLLGRIEADAAAGHLAALASSPAG